jgi:hypothetical protein
MDERVGCVGFRVATVRRIEENDGVAAAGVGAGVGPDRIAEPRNIGAGGGAGGGGARSVDPRNVGAGGGFGGGVVVTVTPSLGKRPIG